ncbi:MAG: DUF3103 family protein [Algicola sp.]|nr:DUF3103 family protein [Algicola sp.]
MITTKKSIALLSSSLFGGIVLSAFSLNATANTQMTDAHQPLTPNDEARQQAPFKMDFAQQKRTVALNIAQQYQQLKPMLAGINREQQSLSLQTLGNSGQLDLSEFKSFEQAVINAKGFDANITNLVELRLADKSMLSTLQNGMTPLFAFEPAGDEDQWQYIEAFDSNGNTHLLDVHEMPNRPVLVVDINARTDLKAGIAQMKAVFEGFSGNVPSAIIADKGETSAVLETSVLKKISLKNDEEPWIAGNAEIYAVVNGVDASREKPILDVVDMPYLDDEDTTYSPNQIVIFWERYRWNAADMILMEHDDNTNYKDLAIALTNTAGAIMAAIPDPTTQGLAVLGRITGELISAMPDDWFINDDDYVDVFYTILKGSTYTNHYGASGNAKISLEPLTIN